MATPVSDRLREAMNGHDIDAFVGCFTPDYRSDAGAFLKTIGVSRPRRRRLSVSACAVGSTTGRPPITGELRATSVVSSSPRLLAHSQRHVGLDLVGVRILEVAATA